jgi:outer membrane protein assembly factor BamB
MDSFMPHKPKSHRLGVPLVIAGLALAGIGVIRLQPELEQNFKSWLTSAVALLAVLLGFLWFLVLSRFNSRLRLAAFGVVVLSVFGLTQVLRVDGTVNGSGLPKLVWRWTTPAAHGLDALPAGPGTNEAIPAVATEQVADMPQFFGPNRDGVVKNARLARDWTTTPPKQLWRQPAGAGWSAFAVVDGRAYTQEQRGENECVTCYNLLTGRLIWSHGNAVHFSQWQGGDGPRATPTVLDGRVFAMGATGLLDCLDAKTGQGLWSRDVLAENKLPNLVWGVSDSPLVFDDRVIVTGGLSNGPSVLAYRRSDGEPLWRAGTDKAGYASPVLAQLAGRRVVLSCNAASLTAHDPATGELLLSYPWSDDKWPKASQPVVIENDRVFLSAGYGTGCVLMKLNIGSDGKFVATQLWKNLRMKTQFNSVAVRDGYLYGLDDGLLACVEIATGERKWKEGRYGSGQTLLVDDLVLIQTEPGAVVLAEASPSGVRELGRFAALNGKTWNHPTLAGRYLLVRNSQEMVCYELPIQQATNQPQTNPGSRRSGTTNAG